MNTYSTFAKVTSEVKYHDSVTGSFVTFTVADATRKKVGNRMEWVSMFVDCVAWGKLAEFISHSLKKGDIVFVCGEISISEYAGKDGSQHYSTRLNVDRFKVGRNTVREEPEDGLPAADDDINLGDDLPVF